MDPNQMTESTQVALHDAQTKALRFGHTEVDVEHLLLALVEQPEGLIGRVLERAEGGVSALRAALGGGGGAPPANAGARRRPGQGLRGADAGAGARRRRRGGAAPEGRVRLGRA